MQRQREALKLYKPFMVVGTPGRIAELSRDGALQVRCAALFCAVMCCPARGVVLLQSGARVWCTCTLCPHVRELVL